MESVTGKFFEGVNVCRQFLQAFFHGGDFGFVEFDLTLLLTEFYPGFGPAYEVVFTEETDYEKKQAGGEGGIPYE